MTDGELPLAKFIRLKNGDDIVADMVELSDDEFTTYYLINPLKVVYAPSTSSGYLTVAFMPWVFPRIVDFQEFSVDGDDVLLVSDVSPSMNEYYWKNVKHYIDVVKESPLEVAEEEPNREEEYENIKEALEALATKRTLH